MTKNQIVIVTQMDDPHADDVIMMLHDLGHEPIRLNSDDIPEHTTLSLGLSDSSWEGGIAIETNGRVIDINDIRSIWWRRPDAYALPDTLSPQERTFAQDEIDHTLSSLWAATDCYWMSHPDHIRRASWKGEQLLRAKRGGRPSRPHPPADILAWFDTQIASVPAPIASMDLIRVGLVRCTLEEWEHGEAIGEIALTGERILVE